MASVERLKATLDSYPEYRNDAAFISELFSSQQVSCQVLR